MWPPKKMERAGGMGKMNEGEAPVLPSVTVGRECREEDVLIMWPGTLSTDDREGGPQMFSLNLMRRRISWWYSWCSYDCSAILLASLYQRWEITSKVCWLFMPIQWVHVLRYLLENLVFFTFLGFYHLMKNLRSSVELKQFSILSFMWIWACWVCLHGSQQGRWPSLETRAPRPDQSMWCSLKLGIVWKGPFRFNPKNPTGLVLRPSFSLHCRCSNPAQSTLHRRHHTY